MGKSVLKYPSSFNSSVQSNPSSDDPLLLEEILCVDWVDGVANAANASGSEEDICVLTTVKFAKPTRKGKKHQRFTGSNFNIIRK